MTEEQNKPREYDAVLGAEAPPPTNRAVLGGIEGVKMRLNSTVEKTRLSAISEAMKYGDAGLDLVIEALKNRSFLVRKAAVNCLLQLQEKPKVERALRKYPWLLLKCMYVSSAPHSGFVSSVAVTPDGKTVVSGSADGAIRVWDLHSLALLRTFVENKPSHLPIRVVSVAISPDGNTIFSSTSDRLIKFWDLHSDGIIGSIREDFVSLAVTTDGKILVGGTDYGTIKIRSLCGVLISEGPKPAIFQITLPEGKLTGLSRGHSHPVNSVVITPDGKTIFSGSADSTIKIWDWRSRRLTRTLAGHSLEVSSVAIAPDGNTLVSGGGDKSIKVWDWRSGKLIRTLTGHSLRVSSVAITPDNKNIVSGSIDKTIKIWDLLSGKLIRTLEEHPSEILSIAITPDGESIVSGSADGTIQVWGIK